VSVMEIEVDSKRSNPLLNRTEVYFTIHHKGEGTPNREIIRSELAEKLNVKKDNIVVDNIHSSFGVQESTGYAKVYTSAEKLKDWEREHILVRNKIIEKKEKEKEERTPEEKPAEKPKEKPETVEEPEKEEKPPEPKEEKPAEKPEEEKPAEKTPKEEAGEPEKAEKSEEPSDKKKQPTESSKEEPSGESGQPAEEKKE